MIHIRVKPNLLNGNKNIDMVRLHNSQYPYEDVDTFFLGEKVCVVESGRSHGHKNMYGGIGIQGYHSKENHDSIDHRYTREEGNVPIYDEPMSEVLQRWHCYKCDEKDIPSTYNIYYNNYPDDGILYPKQKMDLIDVHKSELLLPLGRFPDIASLPWTFCCNVLQHHDSVEDEIEVIYEDKEISILLYGIYLSSINVSFSDESNDCIDIKRWIIANVNKKDSFQTMREKIPCDILIKIRYHLENAYLNASYCDECEYLCKLRKRFD